ncbi:sensor histidine kinase [Paenibacillus albiflavus]|uniref:histidine kinase n=1 Tax=Paenibacillus albiflavus TaxID=2545760 RepID=A0A4R4E4V3_9BACL|nr:histidine kinase [Paenibacillus albiflavus]TCZ74636.1 sensor histidine kinase [Paenibacillus albiflavus]
MSMRKYKLITILLPPLLIGGFEYFRHEFLLDYLSMEAGNFYITLLTLILSYLVGTWMFKNVEQSNQELVQEQAMRAVYEERERLARELHDDLAQTLFFLNVKLKQGQIDEAREAVSEIDNNLRQAIFNLRTSPENAVSFSNRILQWLQDWRLLTGVAITSTIQINEREFHTSEETQLFGIIQEAFTNIRKHSKATKATITFQAIAEGWSLTIIDNGIGIQPKHDTTKQYGIAMMRNRAQELGAKWELTTAVEGGTKLHMYTDIRR